jgi:hypothetical protein
MKALKIIGIATVMPVAFTVLLVVIWALGWWISSVWNFCERILG